MRHAFLICAHNNFNLLERLICQLDDPSFDCYVHIDKKAGGFDYEHFERLPQHSKVYFLRKRISVLWGDVSQIEVTFRLIEEALKNGKYNYLHFISGVDFPIKSNKYIKNFFQINNGKEFVGFSSWTPVLDFKLGKYHIVPRDYQNKYKWLEKVYSFSLAIQNKLHISHFKNTHTFSKGCNWWSITGNLATDILSCRRELEKKYRYTLCADEVFFQTYVMGNNRYKDAIYDKHDEYKGCLRLINWERGNPYVWKDSDFDELMNSSAIFARKFSEDNMTLIDKLQEELKKK